jgi:hypothetical protein
MITYDAVYTSGSRPYLAKTITLGGESLETKLGAAMPKEELALIPLSSIYSHLDNLVLHIQERSLTLQASRLDSPSVDLSTPIIGYKEIESTYGEALDWFQYLFKTREPEELEEENPA